jgi:hypothetical protein
MNGTENHEKGVCSECKVVKNSDLNQIIYFVMNKWLFAKAGVCVAQSVSEWGMSAVIRDLTIL